MGKFKCGMCGKHVDEKANFCSSCGSDLIVGSEVSESFEFDLENPYETPEQKSRKSFESGKLTSSTKKGLVIFASFVVGLIVVGQVANSILPTNGSASSSEQTVANQEIQEEIKTEAVFFDLETIPLFTGYSAQSAAVLMRESFNESFSSIDNLDTGEDLRTRFSRDRHLDELEGLFVCSQNYAPGADPSETAFSRLRIEVSSACAGEKPDIALGQAARDLDMPSFTPIGGECYQAKRCDIEEMDGIFLGFDGEGYRGHKTGRVLTAIGELEIELAFVDLSSEWCEADDSMKIAAISARDEILTEGDFVRLKGAEDLYGDRRIVHRLDVQGSLIDGSPPKNSVNELLVKTGYWVPSDDAGDHPWENVGYFQEEMINASWSTEKIENPEKEMSLYRNRILEAADESFSKPNAQLATCLEEKNDAVVVLIADKEEELAEESRERNARASDVEAVWRSVFCPTMSEKYPERCASYNPEVDDKVGTGSGGSGGSSIGSNCTWVDGHYRGGSFVSGHWRCY